MYQPCLDGKERLGYGWQGASTKSPHIPEQVLREETVLGSILEPLLHMDSLWSNVYCSFSTMLGNRPCGLGLLSVDYDGEGTKHLQQFIRTPSPTPPAARTTPHIPAATPTPTTTTTLAPTTPSPAPTPTPTTPHQHQHQLQHHHHYPQLSLIHI